MNIFSNTPTGDKTDYLMSVLCVIVVFNILKLPLLAIIGIFWVKTYKLPIMGEGFSMKINGKKLSQLLLFILAGAALGLFSLGGQTWMGALLNHFISPSSYLVPTAFLQKSGLPLSHDLLISAVTAVVMELTFRRCLYNEWSKYGIMAAVIGSGITAMLLSSILNWYGTLLLGIGAALVYETTRCLAMTAAFHIAFLWSQDIWREIGGPGLEQITLIAVVSLVLAVAALFAALKISDNWTMVKTKIKVQHENKEKHPYIFRTSWNTMMFCVFIFGTMPIWVSLFYR